MPFRELPIPAQLAVASYMAEITRDFCSTLPWLQKKYGSKRIGYVEIPMEVLTGAVMQDEAVQAELPGTTEEDFELYHRWYMKQGDMPDHPTTELWPVILSSDYDEETLQDGWHRFHDYYRKGVEMVPAVYFP
jgi:hypothetical protein